MSLKNTKRIVFYNLSILLAISSLTVCFSSCSNTAKQEGLYQSRVNEATELYNGLCQAVVTINDNNREYIQSTISQIDNGTFSEAEDAVAFDKMFEAIDNQLRMLNINGLCDSTSNGSLTDIEKFDKWPIELKNKAEKLESIIKDLRAVGYKLGGFHERRVVWAGEPWASANSPYYHNLPSIPELSMTIDGLGHKLDGLAPGTYTSFYQSNDEAKKLETEAISNFDLNRPKAIEQFTSAAQQGQAHSMYCLGLISEDNGNITEAKKWYEKAAIAGSTKAMIELAQTYYDPLNRNHQSKSKGDRQLAKKWYQRAANFGNSDGVYGMALNYYMGWYDEKNDETANNYCTIGILLHSAQCAIVKGALQTDKNEQAKYYRLALTFDPNNRPAKENLRRLGFN